MSLSGDIVARVYALLNASAALGTVTRGNVMFNENDLPSCCVHTGGTVVLDIRGDRMGMEMPVIIKAYRNYVHHPEDEISALIDAVRAAVEVDDATLAGYLAGKDRLELDGYEPVYPDSAGSVVGVQFSYGAPHNSNFGGSD